MPIVMTRPTISPLSIPQTITFPATLAAWYAAGIAHYGVGLADVVEVALASEIAAATPANQLVFIAGSKGPGDYDTFQDQAGIVVTPSAGPAVNIADFISRLVDPNVVGEPMLSQFNKSGAALAISEDYKP